MNTVAEEPGALMEAYAHSMTACDEMKMSLPLDKMNLNDWAAAQ